MGFHDIISSDEKSILAPLRRSLAVIEFDLDGAILTAK